MINIPESEWQKFDDYCEKIDKADISDFDKFNTACTLAMCMTVGCYKACNDPVIFEGFRSLMSAFVWSRSHEGCFYWSSIECEIMKTI